MVQILSFPRLKVEDDYTTTEAKIYHPDCSDKCPTSCSQNFEYHYASKWQVDRFIRVSCGKTSNTWKLSIKLLLLYLMKNMYLFNQSSILTCLTIQSQQHPRQQQYPRQRQRRLILVFK